MGYFEKYYPKIKLKLDSFDFLYMIKNHSSLRDVMYDAEKAYGDLFNEITPDEFADYLLDRYTTLRTYEVTQTYFLKVEQNK